MLKIRLSLSAADVTLYEKSHTQHTKMLTKLALRTGSWHERESSWAFRTAILLGRWRGAWCMVS